MAATWRAAGGAVNAFRAIWRAILAAPRWLWGLIALAAMALEVSYSRRQLARAKAQAKAARDSAAAERIAAERLELAGARQVAGHAAADRVRDNAAAKIEAASAEVTAAAAAGDAALAAEVDAAFGGGK